MVVYVGEAGVAYPTFQFRARFGLDAEAVEGLDDLDAPFVERAAEFKLAGMGVPAHLEVLEFDPTAGFGVSLERRRTRVSMKCSILGLRQLWQKGGCNILECLSHELRPVFNGAS